MIVPTLQELIATDAVAIVRDSASMGGAVVIDGVSVPGTLEDMGGAEFARPESGYGTRRVRLHVARADWPGAPPLIGRAIAVDGVVTTMTRVETPPGLYVVTGEQRVT